ncbi:coiled-coil alpha-helical rod protein 1 isoform X3 [Brachyistius frenatus]|uniref:coiled-coil alpha-helical rod protein 1 isoform X3 n=1 Tax=Brachyistius frenatus TaxID=100188 RepID=UPI0037E87C94
MERHNTGKDRLLVPTEFTTTAASRNIQEGLVPPSHFASSVQSTGSHSGLKISATQPPISWINPGVTSVPSGDPHPADQWLAIMQAQQEILQLRRENQRIMMLHGDSTRGRTSLDHPSDLGARSKERDEQRSRFESEWRLETEKHKAEVERLKGQVEALRETAEKYREEMRDKNSNLNRHSHEFEAMREEVFKAKTELSRVREELNLSSAQKEKISSQFERLKAKSGEEISKWRKDVEKYKEESRELALKAEMGRLQAKEDAKQQIMKLSEQLEEMQEKQEVERLNKEKATLQTTTELLTVRLNSMNEILALQEEKMVKKTSTDPLEKNGSEGLRVLQLWREKVFKLCVQLRSKDIELRGEKDKLLSQVGSTEQQLQQEQHRASVLQHSLHDRIAELNLERVEKETLKQHLAKIYNENTQLKSQSQKAEAELKTLTEAVQRFSQAFESKVAEVGSAKASLNTLTHRLTFAKRQVETIQGLVMRKVALQKVGQACKQAEQAADSSFRNLQKDHSLVCEERDKLTQELKRTPELIEKALADLKEQYESKARKQQQELEQSWLEVRQTVAGREKAEETLQQIQAQLEETKVDLEKIRCELLSQQEHSEQALQERVSEIEGQCAEKLRKLEVQASTAMREHTKAVMTLRQFQREATRKQDEMKETQHLVAVAERGPMREHTRVQTTAPPAALRKRRQNPSERSYLTGATVQLPADERLLCVLEELHTLSAAVVNSSEESAEEEEGQRDSVGSSTGHLHS